MVIYSINLLNNPVSVTALYDCILRFFNMYYVFSKCNTIYFESAAPSAWSVAEDLDFRESHLRVVQQSVRFSIVMEPMVAEEPRSTCQNCRVPVNRAGGNNRGITGICATLRRRLPQYQIAVCDRAFGIVMPLSRAPARVTWPEMLFGQFRECSVPLRRSVGTPAD